MSGEQKVSATKRRTRAEVQQLVAEFMSSGMRRSEFCRSRGLSFGTLNRRLKKQRWNRKSRAASSVGRLVPEFMSSGMRRSEFCRSRGLSFGTLNRRLKKQRWNRKSRAASSVGRLVPVELAAKKSPTQHEASCGLVGDF